MEEFGQIILLTKIIFGMRMNIKNNQKKSQRGFFFGYLHYNKLEIQTYYEFHKA
jgi:hypothetical protein